MAVFVTGASGFLGGRLTRMLHDRGEEIVIFTREHSDLRHLEGVPYRRIIGNLADLQVIKRGLSDVTHIFHCAACSTDWAAPATYVEANVAGTTSLLAVASSAPRLIRFVHVSTTDVYGYPEQPCAEDGTLIDAGLPYNQTKRLAELAVWKAFEQDGLPVTILRPATIYGPRGKDFTEEIGLMLRQRLMATIDGGRAPGGFTYVDNVVDAMLLAAHNPRAIGQAYNLSDGTGTTWQTYLELYAAELGVSRPWINLSFRQAMGLATFFQAFHQALRLGGRPLLTRHAVYLLGRTQEFPIQKVIDHLGFKPAVSIEQGIERSAQWFVNSRV